jgi:hypothetical protein
MPDVVSSTPSGDLRWGRSRHLDRSLDDTRLPFALQAPPRRRHVAWTDTHQGVSRAGSAVRRECDLRSASSARLSPGGSHEPCCEETFDQRLQPTCLVFKKRAPSSASISSSWPEPLLRPGRIVRCLLLTSLSRRGLSNRPIPSTLRRIETGRHQLLVRPACALFTRSTFRRSGSPLLAGKPARSLNPTGCLHP